MSKEPVFTYSLKTTLPESEISLLEAGLDAYDRETVGDRRDEFHVMAYEDGRFAGGVRAMTMGGNLYIKHLWVADALRRRGVGAHLVGQAEDEGRHRGCSRVWVDTMSYQAPAFYERLGYRQAARVDSFLPGHDRIFFSKEIVNDDAAKSAA